MRNDTITLFCATVVSNLIWRWLNMPNLNNKQECVEGTLRSWVTSWVCFLGLFGWKALLPSSLPPLQIHGGGHVSGPVAVGRIPEVIGFSARLIELCDARNVWKLKTDVHIISPSFTCLLKPIPPGPDLLSRHAFNFPVRLGPRGQTFNHFPPLQDELHVLYSDEIEVPLGKTA